MSKAQFLKDNLKPGETYAGLVLGANGGPDEHLILLPGRGQDLTWDAAGEWAAYAGGRLPTRQEQSILFANCKPQLIEKWHWSSESYERDASFAWICHFGYGHQDDDPKGYEGSAVAVRTIPLSA